MTWLVIAVVIFGMFGILKVLHAHFTFKLFAITAGTLLSVVLLGIATCPSLGVLCGWIHFAANALDFLQTPLGILIVLVFGGIEREAKKRKQRTKTIIPAGPISAGQEGLPKLSNYCESCGKEAGESVRFCEWCGKPVNESNAQSASKGKPV